MANEEKLTEEEEKQLKEYLGAAIPEEKYNVHSFLYKVATADDTTKLGNLKVEELGMPKYTLRTYKELALIAETIMDNPFLKEYFNKKSEILTSTSLSKDAKLINLAVVQKRQIEDVTPPRKENKGWFKPKNEQNSDSVS